MNKEFNFLVYSAPDKDIKVNAVIKDETIWLTQKAMAELFGVQTPAISKHLKNIFEENELDETATISKMETVQLEGNRQITRLYVKPVYFLHFELFGISEQLTL